MMTNHPEYSAGYYAVVESLNRPPASYNQTCLLTSARLSSGLYLCDVESIVDVHFVIPNVGDNSQYLTISPPNIWPTYFGNM